MGWYKASYEKRKSIWQAEFCNSHEGYVRRRPLLDLALDEPVNEKQDYCTYHIPTYW